MTGDPRERRIELFTRARELPPAERRAFLERECAGSPALVAEILDLLAQDPDAGFLEPFAFPREVLPDLELLEVIGSGAAAIVYRARQLSLDRIVAVKVLRRTPGTDEGDRFRFRQEAQRVSRLQHPNIVPVYSVSREDEDEAYYVMEYVEGGSVLEFLRSAREAAARGGQPEGEADPKHPLYTARVANLLADVADALQECHDAGIIHRDVKPNNVLLRKDGRALLVDFGVARERAVELATELPIGTLYYMSPEQARLYRIRVDHRTDVYSLGVVAYELLTLQRPFEGETQEVICRAIEAATPEPIRRVNPRVPRDLETICHKAIEKLPQDRYRSARELAEDLRRFVRHEPPLARPPSALRALRNTLRRHRRKLVLAGALLAVPLGAFGTSRWAGHIRASSWPRLSLSLHDGEARTDARVWAVPVDGALGVPVPEAEAVDLGGVPLVEEPLAPGTYLVQVEDGRGRLAEAFVSLETSEEHRIVDGVRLRTLDEVTATGQMSPGSDARDTGMILVEAGRLRLGEARLRDEDDAEWVALPAFYVDRFEVTNFEYRRFVEETGHRRPVYWPADEDWPEGWDARPVVGVTSGDAEAYALWAGKRLLTYPEWLFAAAGPEGGNETSGGQAAESAASRANLRRPGRVSTIPPRTGDNDEERRDALRRHYAELAARCGDHPGDVSPAGLFDVLGNVREWTALPPTIDSPGGPSLVRGSRRVAGASFDFPPAPIRTSLVVPAGGYGIDLGFRCARSVVTP